MSANRLFSLLRGKLEEVTIYGEIVVTSGDSVIFQTSEAMGVYPARSLLKPFQFLAADLPDELWPAQKEHRFVAAAGSVSATEDQANRINSWYEGESFKSKIKALRFVPVYPMEERHRVLMREKGLSPNPMHHTCFSKHMAILESCELNHWPLESYAEETHPYHAKLLSVLGELLEESLVGVVCVKDGCRLPTPALTMAQMGKLYAKLAAATNSPLARIAQMMRNFPEWVGGPKRVDTQLIAQNRGAVVAKEGADGLLALGVSPRPGFPDGLGIVIKLMSGYQPPFSVLALAPLLEALGLSSPHEVPKGHEAEYYYTPLKMVPPAIYDISPEVSPRTAVFPGDRPYERSVSLDTEKGDHLTLSSMDTTMHIGAHVDAPGHFQKGCPGIDQLPLEKYVGPAQVIEIKKDKGALIERSDVDGIKLLAPRVLFKTGSYPNPSHFNKDFVAFSKDAVEYLSALGVKLIGIDTPSVDHSESKELEAHHATLARGIAILEGIVLTQVPEGLYELIALPLRLKDSDGSPVRAVLRKLP